MKIAAYCRVSTDKEEQLDSLAHQREFFLEYASQNGHELVKLYADEGISGISLKRRTEFQRLIRDAGSGQFQMVVVKDVSRFARNTVDFLQSIRALKSFGINTLFLTANMESLGESEFILTVFSALAQEESVNLSKRVKFGKKITAKKGRVPPRVFGYDRIDNYTLTVNRHEARIVREIYRLFLDEGLGCRRISEQLNSLGYKTKLGHEWDPRGVRRVLSNSIYCGDYVNHKYEIIDCLLGKARIIPEEERFHHTRPEWAIISPQDFGRAQSLQKERRTKYASQSEAVGGRYSDKHLFSTLIRCEQCGRAFCRKHYTYAKTRIYWKCPTNDQYTAKACDNAVTVTEEELVAEIRNYLSMVTKDREKLIEDVLLEIEKIRAKERTAVDKNAPLKKLTELKRKREKYQELYAAELMTREELKERIEYIEGETVELSRILKEIASREKGEISETERYREEIENFLSLKTITNGDLRKMIKRITVDREGKIKIYLRKISDSDVC